MKLPHRIHQPSCLLSPDAAGGGTAETPPPSTPPDYDAAFAAIDAIPHDSRIPGGPEPEPPAPVTPAPAPQPAPEPAAPVATPDPKATDKPADDDFGMSNLDPKPPEKGKPAPAQKPAEKPKPAEVTPTKGGLAEFRKQYETTRAEADSLKAKLADLEKAKEEGIKVEVDKATKALKEEMAQIQRRAQDLEDNIRFVDYTKSGEYVEKFQKPLEKEWEAILELIDGATFEGEDGERKTITTNDIIALTRMKTGEAATVAGQKFGPLAASIMQHRNNLVRLTNDKHRAIEDWKKNGAAREAEMAKLQSERESGIQRELVSQYAELEQKYPVLFGKDESDPDGNKLLDEGDKLIRLAFRGEGVEGRPAEEAQKIRIKAQAQVVTRARAYGRERLRVNRLTIENNQLKEELKKLRGQEPEIGGDAHAGESDVRGGNSLPEDAIDKL